MNAIHLISRDATQRMFVIFVFQVLIVAHNFQQCHIVSQEHVSSAMKTKNAIENFLYAIARTKLV